MNFINEYFVTICIVLGLICIPIEVILPSFFALMVGISFWIVGIANYFIQLKYEALIAHKYNLLIFSLSLLISFMLYRRYYHNKKHKLNHKDINEY